MKSPQYSTLSADPDGRAARFGLRVAARLTEHSAALPHDVSERLRFAREQALARAAQARAARAPVTVASTNLVQMGASLALGGGTPGSFWSKWVSVLPLALLVAGLLLAQQGQWQQEIVAVAEVDTALLSDNLPPDAFTDPGFTEFLRDAEE